MNLLTDLPTEEVVEARHRPVAAIVGGVVVLVIMLGVGLVLVLNGSGGDEDTVAAANEDAANTVVDADVSLAEWLDGASDACAETVASNPAVLATDGAEPAEIEAGVRTLADGLRALPSPTAASEYSQAMSVIAVGELAEQAWGGAATVDAENSNQTQVGNATALTHEFLDALVAVGASCPTS
ncbi:MAG TPA: hypothetical protein VFZ37_18725 [Jiangellaceae bacterium]